MVRLSFNLIKYLYIVLVWVMFLCYGIAFAEISPSQEVKILIDVSSGMKKVDKDNLRAQGFRAMARMMPMGAKAGAWVFAEECYTLVPMGIVNRDWMHNAVMASEDIYSDGSSNQLEYAINKAIGDWNNVDEKAHRSLIILTSNHLREKYKDQKAREDLLFRLLPKIEKNHIQIHIISLSEEEDDAFKLITQASDGLYQNVRTTEDFHTAFFNVLQQSLNSEALPLKGHQFEVDPYVDEINIVIFRNHQVTPSLIRNPFGDILQEKDDIEGMNWYVDGPLEMIRIDNPMHGRWEIIADIDQRNRILISSSMHIQMKPLPNNIFVGEKLDLRAQLLHNRNIMLDEDFLNLVSLNIEMKTAGQHSSSLTQAMKREGSVFTGQIGPLTKEDENQTKMIKLHMKSHNFSRDITREIRVKPQPVFITSLAKQLPGFSSLNVLVTMDERFIDLDETTVIAQFFNEKEIPSDIHLVRKDNQWVLSMATMTGQKSFKISFYIQGITQQGRNFEFETELGNYIIPDVERITKENVIRQFEDAQEELKDETEDINDEAQKSIEEGENFEGSDVEENDLDDKIEIPEPLSDVLFSRFDETMDDTVDESMEDNVDESMDDVADEKIKIPDSVVEDILKEKLQNEQLMQEESQDSTPESEIQKVDSQEVMSEEKTLEETEMPVKQSKPLSSKQKMIQMIFSILVIIIANIILLVGAFIAYNNYKRAQLKALNDLTSRFDKKEDEESS